MKTRLLTDLHVHLEGSMPIEQILEITSERPHEWSGHSAEMFRKAFRYRDFGEFISAIRRMCGLLASTEALEKTARHLSAMLASHGVIYAEVYASPLIYHRWGIDWNDSMDAIERGFSQAEDAGGARCNILLDSVRQWGAEAAMEVLEHHSRHRSARVVGFGLGGEESVSMADFVDVYERARSLGLRTTVHAGETGPARDVAFAIENLGVDRVAHGFRCLDDAGVLELVRASRTPLDLAVSSNYATHVVKGVHPIRQLLDAGVVVTLGTDDPTLFHTNPSRELRRAVRAGCLDDQDVMSIAANGIERSFATAEMRDRLMSRLRNQSGGLE